MSTSQHGPPNPWHRPLDDSVRRTVRIQFDEPSWERVDELIEWGLATERERLAALKLSEGNIEKLNQAIALGQLDFRDLLVEAGFANDLLAHTHWKPTRLNPDR